MAGLFGGKSKMPPPPRAQRMPTEADPSIQAAAMRQRESALRRSGRLSTVLTDQTQDVVGAGGETLGGGGGPAIG